MRKFEYSKQQEILPQKNCTNVPKKFYKQERDWTCSIACIRTILSGIKNIEEVPSEDFFIRIKQKTPTSINCFAIYK